MRILRIYLLTLKRFSYWLFGLLLLLKLGQTFGFYTISGISFGVVFLLLSLADQIWHYTLTAPRDYFFFYNLGFTKRSFWVTILVLNLILSIVLELA